MLAYIIWDVDPDLIRTPITVRWYGVLFAGGFFIGYQLLKRIFRQESIPESWLDKVFVYVLVGTVLGARLGHVFFYDWSYYSQYPEEMLSIWQGGLASHGAAVGIIIALWIYSRRVTKKSILWILDRVAIPVALAGVFIRTGNLMNHEIIGLPADVPWAFVFTRVDQIPRHPAQLYEAIIYLISFGLLIWFYWKTKMKEKPGALFGVFLICIFLTRVFIEFFKENQVAFEDSLSLNMGQMLSVPFALIGLYFVVRKGA